jgi:hypothetical protein
MRRMGGHTRARGGLVMLALASLLASSLLVHAQKVEVQVIENEIFVKDASGTWRQVTHDGERKENVTVSPALGKIVYNRPWVPYGGESPVFVVLDFETGRVLKEIRPEIWLSRLLSKVEWIDERFLMVIGEYLIILDTEEGKQTQFLHGSPFMLSPDRRKIVFVKGRLPLYGYRPPQYESDEIMLTTVDQRPVGGKMKTARAIYPELRPWGEDEDRRYDDLSERHRVKGWLSWSSDSRKVAFVEEHRGAFWVVVLEIEVKDSEVKVSPRRFELAKEIGEVTGVEWTSEDQAIKVVTEKVTYVVDLGTGEVQVQRSQ